MFQHRHSENVHVINYYWHKNETDCYDSGASGKDFLAEFEGDTLSLYGAGSLDTFDKAWGIQAAGTVTTICFIFIEFDDIVKHLHKVKARFPNVQVGFLVVMSLFVMQCHILGTGWMFLE